eukprot:Seg2224.1 transcript_id=Seg2224.1/GoldUCD/mRNA.D3Y31 product=Fucolectin-1 protein_id=Seg2224.1/GoldUCD/D3Y31
MNFYIVLAISVFAGGSKASGCPIEVTAKEPNYGSEGKFGEVHILSFSTTSGSTSCLWRFSSAKKNLLNLLFINITAQTKASRSGCNGNYALIKTHDAERLSSTTFDPYCGERSLPGIRINGTIEIELHDRGSRSVDRGISLAVFVESSSKHCGGIYNDSSYGVPVSYDSSLVPRNEITHCVWFFEFLQARSLSVIASYFGLEQDLVTGVPNCSRNKQYLSMRSWNRTNWDSYQEIRECKAQSKQTPIFNLPKTDRFAVTVHSEHWFSSKKLYAVCFPSTEGFSDSKLVINGKGNKTYHDVLLDDPNVVEGLLVLKPKEDNDQLFFAMNHGRQFCNGGTLEIWSEHGNTFHRNSSLCSSPNSDLYSVFNFQDTALLYFKSTVSRLKELKIWFYSSNKGCGGLFPFLSGHSIVVKSPNDGNGKYPANSECRWVFLADSTTRIGIAIKTMQLETCCDYVNIYQGFRKQDAKPYRIQGQGKKYVVTGDMEIYFKSDYSDQRTGFMINITEACGGTYSLSSGNSRMIASPGFGTEKYPAYSDCQWNFLASSSTILVIAINEIKLQYLDTTCRYDYIGIYKGVYSAKIIQHKVCSKPKMYLQNGNATIRFQSNGYSQGTGFRIDIFAIEENKYLKMQECGDFDDLRMDQRFEVRNDELASICSKFAPDIALMKAAVQSSTSHNGFASRAVDGNYKFHWSDKSCTHTNDEQDPWWRVDLEKEYIVTDITIINRGEHGERLKNIQAHVGNQLSNHRLNPVCHDRVRFASDGEAVRLQCNPPIPGRYVAIQMYGKGILTMCEVIVASRMGGLADYCLLENGGCDQLCFNKCDKKTSCGCLPGYVLAYDKRTCLGMLYGQVISTGLTRRSTSLHSTAN